MSVIIFGETGELIEKKRDKSFNPVYDRPLLYRLNQPIRSLYHCQEYGGMIHLESIVGVKTRPMKKKDFSYWNWK